MASFSTAGARAANCVVLLLVPLMALPPDSFPPPSTTRPGGGGGGGKTTSFHPPSTTRPGGGGGTTTTTTSGGGGDYAGHGVSKSTYSCNDPVSAWNFLTKYFPVETPSDECTDNVCTCPANGSTPAWEIQQGRVYAKRSDASGSGGHAGNGFGLHCVNVSMHVTTGGMSTSEVEAQFNKKLGDMSTYDAFMDYNVVFSTDGLEQYKQTFKTDGVKYLEGTWSSPDGASYSSIILQVPGTQMILELVQQSSLTSDTEPVAALSLEQRVPTMALPFITGVSKSDISVATSSVGAYIVPLVVNRAASASAMAKLEKFYVGGMGTTKTHDETKNGVTKKCFLWAGATVHVCYTQRADSETKGDWKVSDFEAMLNKVHKNLMDGHPFCGMDKWEDNHYAIDSQTADTSKIVEYINSANPFHYCESSTSGSKGEAYTFPPSGSSTTVHYVWDPTGWGIQLNLQFSSVPSDCQQTALARGRLQDSHTNPACTLDASKCGSQGSALAVVV